MARVYKKDAREMLELFGQGLSIRDICMKFGVSETSYYFIVGRYPELQKAARKKRKKLKEQVTNMKPKGPKISLKKGKKRPRSKDEKLKHLEDRLKREKAKSVELEELLKLAKEELGKS